MQYLFNVILNFFNFFIKIIALKLFLILLNSLNLTHLSLQQSYQIIEGTLKYNDNYLFATFMIYAQYAMMQLFLQLLNSFVESSI